MGCSSLPQGCFLFRAEQNPVCFHVEGLYVGRAMYRTVYISSSEWKNKKNVMQRSVAYTRAMNDTDGFYFFTYSSFLHKSAVKEKKNLIKELKKK